MARRGPRPGRRVDGLRGWAGLALAALSLVAALGSGLQGDAREVSSWVERVQLARRGLASAAVGAREDALASLLDALEELSDLEALRPDAPGDAASRRDRCDALLRATRTLCGLRGELRLADLDALERWSHARRAAELVADPELLSRALYFLGREVLHRGERLQARALFEEGLELQGGGSMRPWHLIELAKIARNLSELEDAEHWAAEVEDAARAVLAEDSPALGTVTCTVAGLRAEIAMSMGNPDVAAEHCRTELELARGLGNPQLICAAVLHQANLYLSTGRLRRLCVLLEEALADPLLEDQAVSRARFELYLGTGLAALGRDDPSENARARSRFESLLEREALPPLDRERLLVRLAEVLVRDGVLERAGALLDEAQARLERALRDGEPAPINQEEFLMAVQARLQMQQGLAEDGLVALRARLEEAQARFAERWRSTPLREGGVGYLRPRMRRDFFGELIGVTLAAEPGPQGVAAAWEHVHRLQALGTWAREAGYVPRPLAELRQLLTRDGQGLLVYLTGPERSHVFLLDDEHLEQVELVAFDRIEEARDRLQLEIAIAPGDRARPVVGEAARDTRLGRAAQELADCLLPDAVRARVAGWSSVRIVGLELLGYVPFELLPWDDERQLWEVLPVSYLPSVPVGVLLAERRAAERRTEASWDLWVVAAPTLTAQVTTRWPELEPLPFLERQRRDLRGALEPSRVRFLVGPQATLAALREPQLESSRALVLFTHGVRDPSRELSVGITLTPTGEHDEGVAWYEDLGEGVGFPRVVVLGACDAGFAPIRRGEDGTAGLGGLALRRGAQAVLVSPRPLEYRAVDRLATVLLERMSQYGQTTAEALQAARTALAADPLRADPFYGQIHVVGLGDETWAPPAGRDDASRGK